MSILAKQTTRAGLFLRNKWESFFTPEELALVDAFEEKGFICPFVNSATVINPVKLYSQGMLNFARRMVEKGFTPDEVEEFEVVVGFDVPQTPVEDKIAFKQCLVHSAGTRARTNTNETVVDNVDNSVVIGAVQEGDAYIVPEDQISLAELDLEETSAETIVEETETTNTNALANTGVVRSRSEEPTICSNPEWGLNEVTFKELFDSMKENLIFRGVEYGATNTKQKAEIIRQLVAQGELPKFKNFRVATEEELNLYLIAHEGQIELPEGIVAEILRRCKERSKRTTGKWRSKQEGAEANTAAEPRVANMNALFGDETVETTEDDAVTGTTENEETIVVPPAETTVIFEPIPDESTTVHADETEEVADTQETTVEPELSREELLTYVYSNLATMDTEILQEVANIINQNR